ncbi:MAG: hypothetical protein ACMG6S_25720 [Byssovorax sp.]
MAQPFTTTRTTRLLRGRGLVALAARRLRATAGGRIATVASVPIVLAFAGIAVALRSADGARSPLEGLVPLAATWLAWAAAAPLALSAARDRRLLERREGLDALAAARGFSSSALEAARALGAMTTIAAALGAPLVLLALFTAALAGSLELAVARLALAALAAVFAVIAGVTLGGLASLGARRGRARGRLLLFAVVAGPWMLADLLGHGAWSIPGALAAVLDFTLRGGRVPA